MAVRKNCSRAHWTENCPRK